MNQSFIFCHGFGFDNRFWKNLTPYFQNKYQKNLPVGIGHSLGLSKLLNSNQPFDYLIGLNSFVNFLGNAPHLRADRTKTLQALTTHFSASPTATLKKFYRRCGFPATYDPMFPINTPALLEELKTLNHTFEIPKNTKMLIIYAQDDIVVPPEIIHDNFSIYPNVILKRMETGKHALGFLQAEQIQKHILEFLDDCN